MEKESSIRILTEMQFDRCTPDVIDSLKANEVFVFGTDTEGHHNSAAAKTAVLSFGASIGKGEGMSGQSYAIPVHKHRVEKMYDAVQRFIAFAKKNTNLKFFVLPIGCGKAGMNTLTVAAMFWKAIDVNNIFLPQSFISALLQYVHLNPNGFKEVGGKLLHQESFGTGLRWSLYSDGTLEISGRGSMQDYINHWDSYHGEGQPKWIGCEKYGVMPYRLIIGSGITYVGANAFESFGCLREVYLADSVVKLGKMAFFDCFHIEKINLPPHMSIMDFDKAELPLFYNKTYVRVNQWLIAQELVSHIED